MPKPTTAELTAKTAELTKQYLEELSDIFSSQEKINEAVNYRGMLIDDDLNDPNSVRKGNVATLDTVHDQFDKNGNQIKGSRFTLHMPDRANLERAQLIRTTDISDREAIAAASAYFTAGAKISMNSPGDILVRDLTIVIRATIAAELKATVGFTEPKGFVPRTAMMEKIQLELKHLDVLEKKIIANFKINPKLKELGDEAKKFSSGHLQEQIKENVMDYPKVTKVSTKQNLLKRANQAIESFIVCADAEKLLADMIEIQRENNARPGHHGLITESTSIINAITKMAQKHVSALNNSLSIGSSSVHSGMYGKSSSSSPDKSPMSPRTPADKLDSDSEDNEKKSPHRSPKG